MFGRALWVMGLTAIVAILPAAPAAAGGCGEMTEGSTTRVVLQDLCFHPAIDRVELGQTVTFVNEDDVDHSVIGAGFSFSSPTMVGPGRSFSHRYDAPGVYPFSCYMHPGMTGVIV